VGDSEGTAEEGLGADTGSASRSEGPTHQSLLSTFEGGTYLEQAHRPFSTSGLLIDQKVIQQVKFDDAYERFHKLYPGG